MTPPTRLLTRGDDAGSSESANRAILEACQHGILRNVSVMVPGPAFAQAATLFAAVPGIAVGLHVTLNAEWDTPKWRPVLPVVQVPSLVDEQGFFWPSPNVSQERRARVDEMLAEIAAQLDRARSAGLPIAYIDEHMAVSWPWPELRTGIADLARREGLVDAHHVLFSPPPEGLAAGDDPTENLLAFLHALTPGTYFYLTHPMFDTPDVVGHIMLDIPAGRVARERDCDRRTLQDPRVLALCREHGIEVIRYTDAASR